MEYYQYYQNEIENIKKLKAEQQAFRQNIQNYDFKKNENELVLKELEYVDEGEEVFKLVGPMLVREEPSEAKQNVIKRIEFISKEM
jgi:prefoldin beta subunit